MLYSFIYSNAVNQAIEYFKFKKAPQTSSVRRADDIRRKNV